MQLNRLTLTQFRAFKQATFSFHPGMNLLVGINGVGKSTVLDALRIMLSQVMPIFTASRSNPFDFKVSDITVGRGALTAEIEFQAAEIDFQYLVHKPRHGYVIDTSRQGEVRDQTYDLIERQDLTPDRKAISKKLRSASKQPLAIYFSTRRSLPIMKASRSSAGSQAAAFNESLDHRELRLREFADWWRVQEALTKEDDLDKAKQAKQNLNALDNAVIHFMDTVTHLRAVHEPETTLVIDKNGVTLDVRQLSDGERGVLALVLDLARRLSQANPGSEDPLYEGQALVLIDELDLHLHPIWQRDIVAKLTTTFPGCQFIATTHSPLIVGEVKPPGISLISKEDNQLVVIQEGIPGYGLASSWILEHLMGATSRNASTQAQIDVVENALGEGDLELARSRLEQLKTMIQVYDDEVIHLEASINNLEALAKDVDLDDEMDSEAE